MNEPLAPEPGAALDPVDPSPDDDAGADDELDGLDLPAVLDPADAGAADGDVETVDTSDTDPDADDTDPDIRNDDLDPAGGEPDDPAPTSDPDPAAQDLDFPGRPLTDEEIEALGDD